MHRFFACMPVKDRTHSTTAAYRHTAIQSPPQYACTENHVAPTASGIMRLPPATLARLLRPRIIEARESRDEIQKQRPGGPVTLLGDNDLRLGPLRLGHFLVAIVISLAVNECHHVGILLDRA